MALEYRKDGDVNWSNGIFVLSFLPNVLFVIWCIQVSINQHGKKAAWFRRETWYRMLIAAMLQPISLIR